MFYNYLIFSKVTLSLRICLKYLVSPIETLCFTARNRLFHREKRLVFLAGIKKAKPTAHTQWYRQPVSLSIFIRDNPY